MNNYFPSFAVLRCLARNILLWKKSLLSLMLLCVGGSLYAQTGPGGIGSTDGSSILELWFDANAGITGVSPITGVIDQSGNGVSITVSGAPVLNAGSVNGVDAISFDALVGDFLTTDLSINAGSVPRLTVVTVYQSARASAGDPSIGSLWGEVDAGPDPNIDRIVGRGLSTGDVSDGDNFPVFANGLFVGNQPGLATIIYHEDAINGSQVYNFGSLLLSFTADHSRSGASNPLQIGASGAGTGGDTFNGDISELLVYSDTLSEAQRIIVENYLSAKYGLSLAANDLYTMDNAANGNYDFEVAGIGVGADGSSLLVSRGSSIVTVSAGTVPSDSTFLFWGNNGEGELFMEVSDVPAGIGGRLNTVWRVSENGGDVGSVDMVFALTGLNLSVLGGNVRLLLDSDGDFSTTDNVETGTFNSVNNTITFANINLTDGQYFSIGQTPTTAPVLANALSDISVFEDSAPDTINLSDVFTDPDIGAFDAPLFFSATALDDDLVTVSLLQDSLLVLNYLLDSVGMDTVVVFATEGSSAGVRDTLIVTVSPSNDAPRLVSAFADVSASTGRLLSLNLSANFSDPEGDAVTYTSTLSDGVALPSWLSFEDGTATFSGIPLAGDVGSLDVVVAASDGTLSSSDTFTLTVIDAIVTGPGGVGSADGNSSLELWFDANAGITGATRITGVTDQSGNGVRFTVRGDPTLNASSVNGMDAVTFDRVFDHFVTDLSINAGTVPRVTVLSVYLPRSSASRVVWSEDDGGFDRFLRDHATLAAGNNSVSNGSTYEGNIPNLFSSGRYSLSTVVHQEDVTDGSEVYVSGSLARSFTSNHAPEPSSSFHIGSNPSGSSFEGDIAELLVYSDTLSTVERIIVENYVSAKYGLSLAANDLYTMDNAANGNYDFEVAGIGVGADGIGLLVSRGTGIVRVSARSVASNGRFLFWGNNGEEELFIEVSDVPAGIGGRLNTVWRVSESGGDVGAVDMSFDLTGLNLSVLGGNVRLLLDSDGDFSTTDNVETGTFNAVNNTITFANINLTNGQYFSIGQTPTTAPVVANALADRSVDEDSAPDTISLVGVFVDPDIGDFDAPLFFSATALDDDLVTVSLLQDSLLVLNYLPEGSGIDTVVVFATEGSSSSGRDTLIVTVNAVNDAPRLASPFADVSTTTGRIFSLDLSTNFSDQDGDALTYTSTLSDGVALPSWLNFEDGTATFSGIPLPSDVGASDVVVTASDGSSSVSDTFTLTVIDAIVTGPGGVGSADGSSSLELWFDANAGITGSMPVTGVTDQSGNGVTLTVGGDPALNASSVNGIDAITFDGTGDFLTTNLSINADSVPRLSVLSVYRPRVNGARAVWGEDNGGFDRFLQDHPTFAAGNNSVSSGTGFEGNITDLFVTANYSLSTVVHQEDVTDGSAVYVSGGLARTFTSNHAPETSSPLQIAAIGAGGSAFDGDIAEVLVYGDTLSAAQRIIAENYLSAKYGLSLAANDLYTMDNAANGNYDFDVAGIGVAADGSDLLEARGTGIATAIARSIPSNGRFLFWGDNGQAAAFTETSDVPVDFRNRLSKVWRVSESAGDIGNINMSFDLSGIAVASGDIRLALSVNNVFASVDDTLRGSFNGATNILTFADVNLPDSIYFTLFQPSQLPVVASAIADISVDEDADPDTIILSNVFFDPQNDPLTFRVVNNNTDLLLAEVNNDTLQLRYAADSSGTARLIVSAADASSGSVSDTFNVTVNAVNDAPVVVNPIADLIVDEDADPSTIVLSDVFSDPEDNALTFRVVNNNTDLLLAEVSNDTLQLRYAADSSGTARLIVSAADASSGSVSDTFNVTVNAVNDAPVVSSAIADLTVDEDAPSTDDYVALNSVFTDIEGDDLSFAVANNNTSLVTAAIDSEDNLDLSFAANSAGDAQIIITANDGNGGTVQDTFTVTITPTDAPEIRNPIADLTVAEDAAARNNYVALNSVFVDPQGDELTFAVANTNTSLVTAAIDSDDNLDLSFAANGNGTAQLTITANDGNGNTAFDIFIVTVNAVNDVPVVANAIADLTVAEDAAARNNYAALNTVFTDIEGDELTFAVANTDTSLVTAVIDADDNLDLSFAANGNGTAQLTITADDGNGGTVNDVFTVTVSAVNDAPVVSSAIADLTVAEDAAARNNYAALNTVFTDVDGDELSFTVANTNTGLVTAAIDAEDNLDLSFAANGNGTAQLTLTADDGSGGTVNEVFTVTVSAVNDAPTAINLSNTTIAENEPSGTSVGTFTTSDVDPTDSHTYSLVAGAGDTDNSSFSINNDELLSAQEFDFEAKASYAIRVRVDDGNGGTFEREFTIAITDEDEDPNAIDFNDISDAVSIYPNPVVDRLHISVVNDLFGLLEIYLYNSSGQLLSHHTSVKQSSTHHIELDIRAIPRGIHLLELKIGKHRAVKRIVK